MKYFVALVIKARDWKLVGKATLNAFQPNSLLQQGVLRGLLVEFAEEKEGEFRRSLGTPKEFR